MKKLSLATFLIFNLSFLSLAAQFREKPVLKVKADLLVLSSYISNRTEFDFFTSHDKSEQLKNLLVMTNKLSEKERMGSDKKSLAAFCALESAFSLLCMERLLYYTNNNMFFLIFWPLTTVTAGVYGLNSLQCVWNCLNYARESKSYKVSRFELNDIVLRYNMLHPKIRLALI